MIFDPAGRLLILKPVYKSGWTIPGGVMEAGETPWSACQREVREECGLVVRRGRLACVDFRPPRRGKLGGLRFLFDCGPLPAESFAAMVLQREEISKYRIEPLPAALDLLRKPIRRRVSAAIGSSGLRYLENGRPVPGVRP
jgi:8-oxo-dGTP diphosphatase